MTQLPQQLLTATEQLLMVGNHLTTIKPVPQSFLELKTIDLQRSNISEISAQALEALLLHSHNLKLSGNQLHHMSSVLSKSNQTNLWLSKNPFECGCDMMWMRDWLLNATNVKDKENITCAAGKWNGKNFCDTNMLHGQNKSCISPWNVIFPGTAIFQLDRTMMGCVAFPIWIGIITGIAIVAVVITLIITNRKWEAIKFLLFMKFNILTNDDEPENVDELEFDAFIAYR